MEVVFISIREYKNLQHALQLNSKQEISSFLLQVISEKIVYFSKVKIVFTKISARIYDFFLALLVIGARKIV